MSEGTEKLIGRILDEAKQDAQAAIAQANEKAEAIRAESKAQVNAIREKGEAQAKQMETDIIFRAKKNAELDAKKADLAARHMMIDKAFAAAKEKLDAMSAADCAEFFRKLLFREAEGGETVRPSSKHAYIIAGIIPNINEMLEKEKSERLIAGEATDAIEDGFILEGKGYIKNCSFSELMNDLRERELGRIDDILF